jgi:serine palmitoyltransferase
VTNDEKDVEIRSCLEGNGQPAMIAPRWKLQEIIRRGVADVKQPLC